MRKHRVFGTGLIMILLSIAAAGYAFADAGQWRAAPGLSCQGSITGIYSDTGGSLIMSAVESANTDTIKIHYAVPEPIFETLSGQEINGVNTQKCILGNAELVGEPGEPLMPMIRSRVILPKGRTVDSIKISPVESVELDGEYLLAYATKPCPLSSTNIEPTFASDEIYGSDDTFPNKDYSLVSIQDRCGVSIAIIECYPLSYKPLSGSVKYYKEYILEVETTNEQQLKSTDAIKARPERILDGIQSEENPETLESYADSKDLADTDVYANEYSYVIVTGNDIINASTTPNLNDFVAHKQSLGFSVKVEAIEDILATQSGSSNPDKLRNYLRDAYNNWNTKYVLLGGDTNIIPLKTVYASFGGHTDDLPTDLPYQCLSQTSWNDDFEAEVFIGRASAENAAEFSNFVYKTIAFENTNQNDSYIKTVLNLGEQLDSSTYAKAAMEVIKAKYTSDYTINTLYDQDSTWSKYDFVTKVNQNKYSIMNHLGHSNAQYAMKNYISDLQNNPMNNDKFIFVKSQGCIPGAFDQSCMAEYMTTANRNGMWGVVFNSRYGWYNPSNVTNGPSQIVHASFWNAYFSNNLKSVGECNEYSHRVNTNYRWDILESNLFGDPSVVFGGNSGPNTYPLTVANGSGDGSYAAGTSVDITANTPPSGKVFDKWVINSGNPSIANIYSLSTTLTMPASSASVAATYEDDGGGGGDYCTSSGDSHNYEWISGVHIGSMSNTSSASGYSDFTNKTLSVSANETVTVSLTPGFSGGSYTESWKVWIDYNLDGDFEDSGEAVFSKSGSSTVSGSFTVPGSASGATRMRVSMSYGSAPPYCGTFTYGEVEDYTVDIDGGVQTYTLSVISGTGDGDYTPGAQVTITANSAPSGQVFDHWVVNSGSPQISNVNASSTTLTMPYGDVKVTATYKDDGGGGGGGDYCTSSGSSYNYEWIAGVHVGTLNNTSSASGYTDFTNKTLSVSANDSVSVSLTPGFSGGTYTESWKVWIDYNLDGDFEDSGEAVFSKSGSSTVSGSFTVPTSATGTTRMRVSMSYGSAPPYCGTFSYGEVEDYAINISGGSQAYTLTVASGSGDGNYEAGQSVTITANSAPSGQVFDKWVVNSGSPQISNVNASSTTLTMPYGDVKVTATYKDDGGGGGGGDYCTSSGSSYNYEWIAGVHIGTLNNTSSASGYTDFTNKTLSVSANDSVSVSLTPGFSGGTYTEYWKVWIDYNLDGDFEDSGEAVFSKSGSSSVSGSFTVPSSASGATRMRVSMSYGSAPPCCGTFSYGEVEDYTINIGGGAQNYKLSVSNGSGDGNYEAGKSVSITANTPPSGQVFDQWAINSGSPQIANVNASSTTLTMPAGNVTISATYTDGGGGGDYCTSSGNTNNYEWIAGVHIGTLNNTSGASGYTDFTNKTLSVSTNESISVSLTPGFSGGSYTENWRIWIDYNRDGDFEDSGEEVYSNSGSSSVSGSFTVPSSATGITNMRVSMSYGSAPPCCGTFSYGEVEDYTVIVGY